MRHQKLQLHKLRQSNEPLRLYKETSLRFVTQEHRRCLDYNRHPRLVVWMSDWDRYLVVANFKTWLVNGHGRFKDNWRPVVKAEAAPDF
jgi:hypothetical protein